MTRGSDTKPLVRLLKTSDAEEYLVVEVKAGSLVIRPYKSRKGGAGEVTVNIGTVYQRALMHRVAPL
jgi:hypothetical protein